MAKSIKLSPKHGVNPTIPVCFFCGNDRNEVALMGKVNKEDDEMPMHAVIDYEPCDECKEKMSQGILLVGVKSTAPDNRPPIAHGQYPTGAWCVVSERLICDMVEDEELRNSILKARRSIADDEIVQSLIEQFEEM